MITNWNGALPYITGTNYTYDYDTSTTTTNGTSTTINNGIPLE